MIYTLTGDCPRCGAPVYETQLQKWDSVEAYQRASEAQTVREALTALKDAQMPAPGVHYTCTCHKTLPAPLPEVDDEVSESVDDADRKTMARARTVREPESGEQVSD